MFTSWWFITIIDYCPYHKCHCKWYLHSKEKKRGWGIAVTIQRYMYAFLGGGKKMNIVQVFRHTLT